MIDELTREKVQELNDMFTVDVLVTPYTVRMVDEDKDPKFAEVSAYCDSSVRGMVIAKHKPELLNRGDLQEVTRRILRHELIHDFLDEGGLDGSTRNDWAANEEMVDWIASQFPKLLKAFEAAGAMET